MEKENKNIDKYSVRFNIMAILLIAIFCFSISPITLQNDTFYTIKIGEHIIQNGIDMHDPFSFHDLKYTYPHWLYDVMIYLIYNIGGQVRNIHFNRSLMYDIGVTYLLHKRKINKK